MQIKAIHKLRRDRKVCDRRISECPQQSTLQLHGKNHREKNSPQ